MKPKTINLLLLSALSITVSLAMLGAPALAQNGSGIVKTNTKILYHNGPVMQGTSDVYLIWYGNWAGDTTTAILTDLVSNLGSSPYFLINTTYPDLTGGAPNGGLIYGGAIDDAYSHGPTLTVSNIQGIVRDQFPANNLPVDPAGIYIVLGSSDVTDIRPDGTTFCTPSSPPHHGIFQYAGTNVKCAFIGDARRCPTSAAPQFVAPDGSLLPTPNGNFGGDAMASAMAHVLDAIVTNPLGTGVQYSGWYDRYGLENASKCRGTFGQTYESANGSPANMRLGQRDFLIQQNWVNARKGYCGLSYP